MVSKDRIEEVDILKQALVKLLDHHLHGIIQSKRLICPYNIILMMYHLSSIATIAGILEIKGGIEVAVRIVIFPMVGITDMRKIQCYHWIH